MSLATPAFAVIIPYYQTVPGLLLRAVKSALAQEDVSVQIIVVDDGSPNPAKAELQDVSADRVTIIEQANAGPGAARNHGLKSIPAGIDYVAFLDSDDVWLPTHLARASLAFAAGADLYFTDYVPLRSDRSTFAVCDFPADTLSPDQNGLHTCTGDLFDALLRRSPIGTSTVAYRRAVTAEEFPTNFSYGEDVFFWMHLVRHSRKIMFSTECEAIYGAGVNIAASAVWGSPVILRKLHSEYKFHQAVAETFPLSAAQCVWSDGYRRQVFRNFTANFRHLSLRGRRVGWRQAAEILILEAKRRLR